MAEVTLHIFRPVDRSFQSSIISSHHVGGCETVNKARNGIQVLHTILLGAFSAQVCAELFEINGFSFNDFELSLQVEVQ
ncbi:MAG: Uncharacterised protein [Synechococcus sp. CC9902]|nr:MAG: Uncharacterised protein [Synechococcus sp. CC9902]